MTSQTTKNGEEKKVSETVFLTSENAHELVDRINSYTGTTRYKAILPNGVITTELRYAWFDGRDLLVKMWGDPPAGSCWIFLTKGVTVKVTFEENSVSLEWMFDGITKFICYPRLA